MSNIYVDGHGLGMTKMILQKLSGASWQNSSKYAPWANLVASAS